MTKYTRKVLLAVTDKTVAEGFAKFLNERGLETNAASDGATAMEIALRETPVLIILDLYLPVIKGERLFQILKNNPNTSKVPFLFLSESHKEVKGFRIGIDWFVTKPFQWEELYGNIKEILSRGGGVWSLWDKDLQGKLSNVHLADVIQMLYLNKREGELTVETDASSGTIYMKDGYIFNARIGEIEKEKALFRILSWKEGTFEFRPAAVRSGAKLALSTGNLIMEGMRQIDEYENSKHLFPAGDSSLKTKVDTAELPAGLKPIMIEVLNLVKYYPVVKALVDHSAFPDFDVYSTLAGLIKRQILTEVKEPGKTRAASEDLCPVSHAIKIKEKFINRWSDMLTVNFGKLLVASTSPVLTNRFVKACQDLPGFLVSPRIASARYSSANALGDLGVLRLYGGTEIIPFAVPAVKGMNPLLKAVLANTVGLLLLWDDEGEAEIPNLALTRNEILSKRRVPAVHVYAGKNELDKALINEYRKLLGLKHDDPVFSLFSQHKNRNNISDIFQRYFTALLREDYISGRVRAV